MADDQNDQQDQHEESDEDEHAQSGGKQDESSGAKGGFTAITSQDDLDRIIRARLGREKKSIAKEIREEIEAETKAATAKEQGDFKKLYEDLDKAHKELKADMDARDLRDRKRAAVSVGHDPTQPPS